MTNLGNGRILNNQASGYASSGKLTITIDDLVVNTGITRAILFRNLGPNVVSLTQVERFKSELVSFVSEGLSSSVLSLIFTPNLAGATEIALAGVAAYRNTDKGAIENVDPVLFEIKELTGFSVVAAGNKKIEVGDIAVGYFASNQSTSNIENSIDKQFAIPYTVAPAGEIVIIVSNVPKIGTLNNKIDLIMSGYSLNL